MIPKVIHYCWFGKKPIPDKYKQYIDSWRKYCPDYEIKEWNESNFDINDSDFAKEAYERKKWAFVSDYVRLKIIYDEGGIYLDIDVELIKSLDNFLNCRCFFGTEPSGYVNTGIGFGAERHNPVIEKMLHQYDNHFVLADGSFDMKPCPQKNSIIIFDLGYQYNKYNIWQNEEVAVYPPDFFCPLDYDTGKLSLTERTVSIHHYGASWHNLWSEIMYKIRKKCIKKFGYKVGEKISGVVTIPFVIFNKASTLGLKNFIVFLFRRLKNK